MYPFELRMRARILKKKRTIYIIIITILALLLLLVTVGSLLINSYLSKVQYDTGDQATGIEDIQGSVLTDEEIIQELLADEPNSDESDSAKEEIAALEEQMAAQLAKNDDISNRAENIAEIDINAENTTDDIFNILVIGCDTRKKGGVGRSDAMILFSVNEGTEKIHMTSIMRDSYVTIPGKGNNRINAAYAFGGGKLLLNTIETNFAVDVDKYVSFDFYSFVDVVDSVGGIDVEVTDAEIPVLNNYVKELNKLNNRAEDAYCVTQSGPQHLNGTQALGYARIRYVGDGDFERTNRQRTVITKIFEKVRTLNILEINNLLNAFLPQVKTNLTQEEILSLLLKALEYLQYDLESHRLPVDDSWKYMRVNGMSVLGIDLEKNQKALKEFISQ